MCRNQKFSSIHNSTGMHFKLSDFATPVHESDKTSAELPVSGASALYLSDKWMRKILLNGSNLLEDFRCALGTSPSFMKADAADSAAKKCGGNVVSN
jgi:hypothetical protein